MKTKATELPRDHDAETLKAEIFARRRFHQIGNRVDETLEQWHRRERGERTIVWIIAIISTPILITLLHYMHQTYGPREPLPFWFVVVSFPLIIASTSSCMMILVFFFLRPRESLGRWIIFGKGILHKYGKSPHRFVPFSSIRRIRVEMPNSRFSCIIFETASEPLRISECSSNANVGDTKEFLPFLNLLIERLQQDGSNAVEIEKLTELHTIIRRRIVFLHCCQYYDWLMMAAYFAPLLLVIPLYPFIQKMEYPVIWFAVIATCLLVFTLRSVLNAFVQRWKNYRIDCIIESLSSPDVNR